MHYRTALVQLPLVKEAAGDLIQTPEDVARVCVDLRDLAQESFQVLTLNTRNALINRHLISLGLANVTLVHPREVFRPAILEGACSVILCHNHPSGDPTPSPDDIRITRKLIEAGRLIDLPVADHIIIGRPEKGIRGFTSLRESGLCDFSKSSI